MGNGPPALLTWPLGTWTLGPQLPPEALGSCWAVALETRGWRAGPLGGRGPGRWRCNWRVVNCALLCSQLENTAPTAERVQALSTFGQRAHWKTLTYPEPTPAAARSATPDVPPQHSQTVSLTHEMCKYRRRHTSVIKKDLWATQRQRELY